MTVEQQEWLEKLPVGGVVKNRLRVAMLLQGMDNQTLARETGLREQYVSAVSTGRIENLSMKNAMLFSRVLGLRPEVLFPAEAGDGRHQDADSTEDR
jgi:transcriptional regulator with XRE-family HTH domain